MRGPLWHESGAGREFDVVGVGQASFDYLGVTERFPSPTGKERLIELRELPGGQIATALLLCAKLGLRAKFLGSVGDDAAGEAVLRPLRRARIDLDGVRVRAGVPSQRALIIVERESGERTVLWHRASGLSLEPRDLSRSELERGRALLLDAGDITASTWAASVARRAGIPVVLDADTPAEGVDRLLAQVDFPIVSREFAETYFGTGEARDALRGMAALGARFPVVTLGVEGAFGGSGDSVIASPGFAVGARDTTGAGDAFHGAFVAGLVEGMGAREILRWANAAAAMNCRAFGAQGGLPTRSQLEAFLRDPDTAEVIP